MEDDPCVPLKSWWLSTPEPQWAGRTGSFSLWVTLEWLRVKRMPSVAWVKRGFSDGSPLGCSVGQISNTITREIPVFLFGSSSIQCASLWGLHKIQLRRRLDTSRAVRISLCAHVCLCVLVHGHACFLMFVHSFVYACFQILPLDLMNKTQQWVSGCGVTLLSIINFSLLEGGCWNLHLLIQNWFGAQAGGRLWVMAGNVNTVASVFNFNKVC